ncbi:MAG: lysylphosphatidylglycerol synthase domain-containing protein [Pseudolysinimonas sp.]
MTARRLLTIASGVVVVVAVVIAVGAGPFARGVAAVSPGAIAAAVLLTALSTAAAATRWRAVAGGLGLTLTWPQAVAACYRSQFLNSVLPGGVVGDVHRAYRHGKGSGEMALAARAVATERIAGQVVQFALMAALLVSLGLTSSLSGMAWVAGTILVVVGMAVAVVAVTARGRRMLRRELVVLRKVFSDPRRSLVVVGSSVVFVASLSATFVVACLAVGVRASLADLIALALIALSAATLPINVGGWGPREAAAASAFAVVGLGAAAGVAASTAFGVLTLIAVAPGAIVLLADRIATIPHVPATTTITEEARA